MEDTPITKVIRFDPIERVLTETLDRRKLYSQKAFQKELFSRLDTLLYSDRDSSNPRILSLDIFDTLVLRDNSSEITRFFEIGALMAELIKSRIGKSISQVDAFLARYMGTVSTYRCREKSQGCREGSLTEIHKLSSRLLTGDDELCDSFIEVEIDYEATRISKNDALLKYVSKHKRNGGRVALISDMYMHSSQISTLLEKLGIQPGDFDFFVSSADTKISKASGHLFHHVQSQLSASAGDFVHLGDSFNGDFIKPMSQGWSAMHLPLSEKDILTRRDDHLETAKTIRAVCGYVPPISMPH